MTYYLLKFKINVRRTLNNSDSINTILSQTSALQEEDGSEVEASPLPPAHW